MSPLRLTALGLLTANIVCLFAVYSNGAELMPVKFDFQGNPISWAPKTHYLLFNIVFLAITNGLIFGIQKMFGNERKLTWVNIPHKDYWIKPENADEALRRFRTGLDGVLVFINAVFLGATYVTAGSASAATVCVFVLGVFLGSGALIVWIYRLFAPRK